MEKNIGEGREVDLTMKKHTYTSKLMREDEQPERGRGDRPIAKLIVGSVTKIEGLVLTEATKCYI
ncbi:hypothetical protein KFK09_008935 [Dendrobium nobile]|uniref:Uncharacterized protein n=1 Tax=Dendrobium nobile TaxID=94219 RepID=A0A8T3BS97_DENNO|nr:hypothetical protein KFK09_008935 [Dendrobium nobile]